MHLTDTDTDRLARTLAHIETLTTHLADNLTPSHAPRDTTTRHPAPGPRPPCNDHALSLLINVEERLREIAGNLAEETLGTISGAPVTPREWAESRRTAATLARFIRRHLDALTHLDWATDAADDIHAVHRDLTAYTDPPPPPGRALDPAVLDTLHPAATIHRLTGIPAGTIRRWGSEGTITKHPGADGRARYRLGDVLDARATT